MSQEMTPEGKGVGRDRIMAGTWGELVLAVLSKALGAGGIRIKRQLPEFMRNPTVVVTGRLLGRSAWCG